MDRKFYLDLAAGGLRMPLGTDLLLRERDDPAAILVDGHRLGDVIVAAARRYRTPLALPLMDLTIEATALLGMLGVPPDRIPTFHFEQPPDEEAFARLDHALPTYKDPRVQATVDAIARVARQSDLLPMGMAIGPFSLMVKLARDPIPGVFLAGRGVPARKNPEVATIERVLELSTRVIEWSLRAQIAAGAKMVVICEPAASNAYISPRQIAAGSDVFDRYVMHFNQRIKALLDETGIDLFFHCCGEITDTVVRKFTELDPAVLSLGGSRKLWEDAALVPKTTVLFGNLPSKKFFSDNEITRAEVERLSCELIRAMCQADHPFILGSECDVLSVPGRHEVILDKVNALLNAKCA